MAASGKQRCTQNEAACALAAPKIVQISATAAETCNRNGEGIEAMVVKCSNLAGDVIAAISIEIAADSKELRRQLATKLDVLPAALQIVLQSGERLRDVESTAPLRELLLK